MKKILLLLSVFLFSCSCSKDDNGCICKSARYCLFGQEGTFYVENIPIDCETKQPLNPSAAYWHHVLLSDRS